MNYNPRSILSESRPSDNLPKLERRDLMPPVTHELWITKSDLEFFKKELLSEIRELLARDTGGEMKKWLKTYEVKKILGLSLGTLQMLRNNGTLPFTKIGGLVLYNYNDLENMMIGNCKAERQKR